MPAALQVVNDPRQAATLLDPERRALLENLDPPDSASGLARRLGLSRQIVNYHLKELEKAGLIGLAEERRKGNCTERVMQRTAVSYVIDPGVLGTLGADPATVADKLSAAYLVAVAARTIKDVSGLSRAAEQSRKILPTLTLETEIRFRSAPERNAFVHEFAAMLSGLVTRYHAAATPSARTFRFTVAAYPAPHRKEKSNGPQPQNSRT